MSDKEQRLALTKYARGGARDQPPVFVGRRAVIEDIEFAAMLAHDKWLSGGVDANDPGLTRLVQGAPGAGKTALLRHLQEKWARGVPGPNHPICINLDVHALSGPDHLRDAIHEALPASTLEQWGGAITGALVAHLTGADGDLGAAAGKAAVAGVRKLLGRERADAFPAPIVVMIDEAQAVEPFTPPARAMLRLHLGRVGDIPVLPVFAGLAYLDSHLQRDGINISRYSNPRQCIHTLEGLSEAECHTLFEGWLRHFGVDAPDDVLERWAAALILDSQGWAMHTNGFLRASAELLAASDNPTVLAAADPDAARRAAAADRADYYNGRYTGIVLDNRRWVGRAMAALDAAGPVWPDNAVRIVGEAGGADERAATALRDALIKRGFLQRCRPGHLLACPIPSLVRHAAIVAMETPDLHTAATLGRVGELKRLLATGADPASQDALGRTALHVAAECRWANVAQALLEAGADPCAPKAGGATPRDAWPDFEWPGECP